MWITNWTSCRYNKSSTTDISVFWKHTYCYSDTQIWRCKFWREKYFEQ